MARTWLRYRGLSICALGALFAALGVSTLSVAAAQTSATDADPLVQFAELMPVFSSPRCLNCHGATNPQTDLNHEGGQVDVPLGTDGNMLGGMGTTDACLECHTAAPPSWRLAPQHMSLVGKDTLPLCRQMRKINQLDDPAMRTVFMHHLENDPLIVLGFVGQGAIGEDSAFAPIQPAPPPLSHGQFLAAAQRWVTDAEAACSNKWNGTITETATWEERVQFREAGSETRITITVVENKATADVHWAMHDFTDVATRECQTYVHHTFTADATRVPMDLTIALRTAPIASGPFTMPELPPGVTLPPGMTMPPAMPELPPGVALPPGMSSPGAAGGPFFLYGPTDHGGLPGNHHADSRTMPGCRQTVSDDKQPYQIAGALIEVSIDPNDPNHLKGEKTGLGNIVIKWDLTRDVE